MLRIIYLEIEFVLIKIFQNNINTKINPTVSNTVIVKNTQLLFFDIYF